MKKAKAITPAEAIDRLLTKFTNQGWRDDGDAARAVVGAAATGEGAADPTALAKAVPETFLIANRITRARVQTVILQALNGARILPAQVQTQQAEAGNVVMKNVRINNTGNWVGNVGSGGAIADVTQNQLNVDEKRVKALTVKYRKDPVAREIVQSPSPAEERKTRLANLVAHAEGVAIDLAAKVASNVIQGK